MFFASVKGCNRIRLFTSAHNSKLGAWLGFYQERHYNVVSLVNSRSPCVAESFPFIVLQLESWGTACPAMKRAGRNVLEIVAQCERRWNRPAPSGQKGTDLWVSTLVRSGWGILPGLFIRMQVCQIQD